MILCGVLCAGKSTIGKKYAERLNLPFFDTDRLMEAIYGKPISVLWQEIGDDAFRDFESEVVESLEPGGVIATGGGTLLRESNRNRLKSLGTPIYLKASVETLYQRILNRGIPPSLGKIDPRGTFYKLAEERFPLLENYCEYIIETDHLTEDGVVERLIAMEIPEFVS